MAFRRLNIELGNRRAAEAAVRRLSGRVLRLQDAERRKVARELHDSIGQYFASLAMNLDLLKNPTLTDTKKADLVAQSLEVVRQGTAETRTLSYAFYEDSLKYDAFGTLFTQPTVIFQGRHDTIVNAKDVERFAVAHPNVSMTLLDDDHQLIKSLPRIWNEVQPFLGL